MGRIYAKEEVCIGCRLCEIHCVVSHSRSKRIIKAFREEPKALPRVMVEEEGIVSFALQCRHCDEPLCVESCMSGAMQIDDGKVLCDSDRCVGCWMCIMSCPFGAIRRDDDHKISSKCDLCADSDEPACVANCPNEALVYEVN